MSFYYFLVVDRIEKQRHVEQQHTTIFVENKQVTRNMLLF